MWKGYRREWLLLALVALSTLAVMNPLNTQDVARLALSRSVAEQRSVRIDAFHELTFDRAYRDGHWYSDKAPGMSFVAIPVVEALRGVDALLGSVEERPIWRRDTRLWVIRVTTGGLALLATTFLVGRVAEGLAPGFGAPSAVTFALGTLAGPLGMTLFAHNAAGAAGFGAFVLAAGAKQHWLPVAGALAGIAVLFEYQAAFIAMVLAAYVGVRFGFRWLVGFCAGAVPAALALGVYDLAAFGSPVHLSYRYVANAYTDEQHAGFFGVHVPSLHGAWVVLFYSRGLLLLSPVLLAAAAGLILLWRRGRRAEAGACLGVSLLFLLTNIGYFEPYGGASPGPRFFAPALPFLAVGLADAYRRWPWPTAGLALLSVMMTTFDAFTWAIANSLKFDLPPNSVWAILTGSREIGTALLVAPIVACILIAGQELVHAQLQRCRTC